ncbi:MAG: SDR family oxidoreductase [Halieaceae bacterium]|nr:SDR family oxidoreductase [Halieaceae bacterium]
MGIYVVTGSASGIGRAVKERLELEGHEVITVDLQNAEIVADLSDERACERVIHQIQEKAPDGLDGFVPCAGLGPHVNDQTLIPLVNYFAVVQLVEQLLPLIERKLGSIVLISSHSAQMLEKYNDDYVDSLLSNNRTKALSLSPQLEAFQVYAAGKHALTRWMRIISASYARAGIRINAVAPGFTRTNFTNSPEAIEKFGDALLEIEKSIPAGRPGEPEDQANAVWFLLSDQAHFINGVYLVVDGGHDAEFRPDKF